MFEPEWYGYETRSFLFEGREAVVVFPKKARQGSPWTLKTEYRTAFPEVELQLLAEGFHGAYIRNDHRWFPPEDIHRKARFIRYVSRTFGLAEQCVPIGMSCGGGYAIKLAGMYPELVRCMYIDAPVTNLCSVPGRNHVPFNDGVWDTEFVKAYPGIGRWQLPGFREHPICFAHVLRQHRIPIIMVWGREDQTVPYAENGLLLEQALEGTGQLKVIGVNGRGHHPHGLIGNNRPIVDFILENCL